MLADDWFGSQRTLHKIGTEGISTNIWSGFYLSSHRIIGWRTLHGNMHKSNWQWRISLDGLQWCFGQAETSTIFLHLIQKFWKECASQMASLCTSRRIGRPDGILFQLYFLYNTGSWLKKWHILTANQALSAWHCHTPSSLIWNHVLWLLWSQHTLMAFSIILCTSHDNARKQTWKFLMNILSQTF